MLFETYLDSLKKEGAALRTIVWRAVNQENFNPRYVVTPTTSSMAMEMLDERLAWLKENHPTAKCVYVFAGIDWIFEDEFVAMCFKLRWF